MDQTPPPPSPPEEVPAAETLSPPPAPGASPELPPSGSDLPEPAPAESAQAPTGQTRAAATPRLGQEIGGKKFRVGTGDRYVPFRSRTKRRRKVIAAGAFCAVIVGAGAYGVVTLVGSDPKPKPVAAACPAHANANPAALLRPVNDLAEAGAGAGAAAGPGAAAQFKLNVYNSTNRKGLAAGAATELKQRGFVIGKVTNDPLKANLTVPAEVRGSAASMQSMRIVAAEVIGAHVRTDTRADGTVDLVLGAGFTALASPDQVATALAAPTPGASKKAPVCH